MRRLENVKELLKTIKKADYEELVIALILNERCDYISEVDDVLQSDVDTASDIYDAFMDNDGMSLLNDGIMDLINGVSEEEDED